MLTKLDKSDIPRYVHPRKSDLRIFCDAAVAEFAAYAEPGDVAEVTGYPAVEGLDPRAMAQKVRSTLVQAAWARGGREDRDRYKAIQRGSRVFLERVEPYRPKAKAPNE